MYEDWLKRYTRLVGDKLWNYVYVATFLNTASKLENPKVKGSTPVRSNWIFSEYSMPTVIIDR